MTAPLDMDQETADYARAQVAEWSKWEAREAISHGPALAYAPGHPVPQSNVAIHGYATAGQVRLQAAWVVANPDDEDVKTFLAWAKTHPDHPDVQVWEAFRAARAEQAEAAADDNPFAPAPEAAEPSAPPRMAPRRATASTDVKE